MRHALAAAAVLAAAVLVPAASALAGTSQESILQDDRLLLKSGPFVQAATLAQVDDLGGDSIHAVVNWRSFAPRPGLRARPAGFDAADPAAYPPGVWTALDGLARGAAQRHISLILSLGGRAPEWAVTCSAAERRRYARGTTGTCRPAPREFAAFSGAVARRYSGSFRDGEGVHLPRVARWSIWNEPNINSWLTPQRVGSTIVAARVYRDLVYAGGAAIQHAAGHRRDQILLGETAPIGHGAKRTSPGVFYRALFCVDARGRRLGGRGAKALGCRARMKRLPVTGVAHHPYTAGPGVQPPLAAQRRDDITVAGAGRLLRVIKLGQKRRMLGRSMPVYYTELGVASSPPARSRLDGVPLSEQAARINQLEYVAWNTRFVRGVGQYEIEDDTGIGTRKFQTGLLFAGGRAKPALAAYRLPLFVARRGKRLTVWGGVRGQKSGYVRLLLRGKRFADVRLSRGYFRKTVGLRSGAWQLEYRPPGGVTAAKPLRSRSARAVLVPPGY